MLARIEALQTRRPQPLAPVLDRPPRGSDVDFTRVSVDLPGPGHGALPASSTP